MKDQDILSRFESLKKLYEEKNRVTKLFFEEEKSFCESIRVKEYKDGNYIIVDGSPYLLREPYVSHGPGLDFGFRYYEIVTVNKYLEGGERSGECYDTCDLFLKENLYIDLRSLLISEGEDRGLFEDKALYSGKEFIFVYHNYARDSTRDLLESLLKSLKPKLSNPKKDYAMITEAFKSAHLIK